MRAALLIFGLSAGLASGQTELTSSSPEGNRIHIFRGSGGQPAVSTLKSFAVTNTNMVQGSGPVMRNPTNYLIFWQPPGRSAFPAGYQTGIEKFFKNVGGTPFYNIVTQYNDKSGNPAPPNSASWGGSWVDTTTAPPSGCNGSIGAVGATPNCPLTDSDVQNEVNAAITANPGWTPGINVEYFVFTPSDVDECSGKDADGNDSCFVINGGPGPKENADFCAYHTYFGGNKIYAYQPFAANGSCYPSASIQALGYPNGQNVDIVLSVVSHELIESNTDPHLDGWKGTGGNDDEIGDKCAYQYGFVAQDGTNVVLNGNRFLLQTEWSNAVTGCAKRFGPLDSLSIPVNINFGPVKAGTTTSVNMNIKNSGAGDASILFVRKGPGTDPGFSLPSLPPTWATLHTSNTMVVAIQFASSTPPRSATGSVIVDTDETPCDSGNSCTTSSNEIVNNLLAAVVIGPSISKSFIPASIPLGANSSLTFKINNPNTVAIHGVGFTDSLPAGVVVAGVVGSCGGGTITAVTGTGSIQLAGATLTTGGGCSFSVTVTGTAAGVKNNVTSNVTSTDAGPGNQATATLLVVAPPVISKAFAPNKVIPGGSTTVNFSITNPNNFVGLTGVGFTDSLPGGVIVATPNGLTSTCGGSAIATAGSGTISLTGGTIASSGSCTVSAKVVGVSEGIYLNSVVVTSTNGGTGNTATDTLYVATPPNLSKSFGAVSIGVNGATSLTFTLMNPNHTVTLHALQFSDTMPVGLDVAAPNGVNGTCPPGSITAIAGSKVITLSSATLAPQTSCTFSVDVMADGTALGLLTNTTSTVLSNEALPGAAASATIFVGDPFQISYAANLNVGDSFVDITNVGTLGAGLQSGTSAGTTGALCANVYAFAADEAMVACCSCPVTPNGLVALSAKNDLAGNTLTIAVPTSLVIKLIATVPVGGSCNNSAAAIGTAALANGMKSFGTTLHAAPSAGVYGVTERPFSAGTLSEGELTRLGNLCTFILANGSGYGICRACTLGGLGSTRQ
jgi:hypothetical protein